MLILRKWNSALLYVSAFFLLFLSAIGCHEVYTHATEIKSQTSKVFSKVNLRKRCFVLKISGDTSPKTSGNKDGCETKLKSMVVLFLGNLTFLLFLSLLSSLTILFSLLVLRFQRRATAEEKETGVFVMTLKHTFASALVLPAVATFGGLFYLHGKLLLSETFLATVFEALQKKVALSQTEEFTLKVYLVAFPLLLLTLLAGFLLRHGTMSLLRARNQLFLVTTAEEAHTYEPDVTASSNTGEGAGDG